MRRAVRTAASVVQRGVDSSGSRWYPVMLTLTYRPGVDYRPRHVSELLKRVREWMDRRGVRFRYVWVAELQRRGAVHWHVLLWLPVRFQIPKPDRRGWWPHGSTRVERARHAAGYIAKYASKMDEDQQFPRGLRLHGRGGLEGPQRCEVRWWVLPRYVREAFGEWQLGGVPVRARGGGWVNADAVWRPPWSDTPAAASA